MFQSNVPLEYWGDCVLTAIFLINRLPATILKDKSPYELLNGKVPDYDVLKVFGCLCYVSTYAKQRHKFQPRARPHIFLGYPTGVKGYRLLDLETNQVHISRNVIFHEELFPLQNKDHVDFDVLFSNKVTEDESVELNTEINVHQKVPITLISEELEDVDIITASPTSNLQELSSAHTPEKHEAESTEVESTEPVEGSENLEDNNSAPKIEKRRQKKPTYLHDYYCGITETGLPYPLANFVTYDQLTEEYKLYMCSVNMFSEANSFSQAKKFKEWLNAMNEELIALENSGTWSICSLPEGKNVVGCRWVYKTKLNADGTLERYKARLVAKGYTQKEGVDFVDTFSPVAKMTTIKTMIGVAAAKGWSLTQLDVSNAFLNGDLHEEIYMTLPPGYKARYGSTLPENVVCKLHKSLYGLKQASRQWFLKFSHTLQSLGFKKSHSDHTLFIKNIDGKYVAVLVYVDDIVIASNDDDEVIQLKKDLHEQFKIRDLGPLRYFLGLEIARSSKGISISQRKYTLELLEESGLLASKPSKIPMEPSIKLCLDSDDPLLSNPEQYRRLVGKMMYLTISRPDITFVVNKLCQFTSAPKSSHLQAAYKVLHYLKGTIGNGVFYSANCDLILRAYTDADWGSCKDTRQSTSGFCMFLGNSMIAWKSKKQQTVALSSAESEYRAMRFALKEVMWLVGLLAEFEAPQERSVPFFCDSVAAIHISKNSVFHERTKHLEIDCHKVREKVLDGLIKPLHVKSEDNLADIFTKPLAAGSFTTILGKMGMSSIYSPS